MKFLRQPSLLGSVVIMAYFLVFAINALHYRLAARIFPLAVAVAGLALMLLVMAGETLPKIGARLQVGYFDTMESDRTPVTRQRKALAAFVGWAFGSFLLVLLVGFSIALPVAAFVYVRCARIPWFKSVLLAVSVYIFVHWLIGVGMGLRLFPGVLFGGMIIG